MTRDRLRQIALWVMAADFPLLYLGAVSLENTVATIAALSVMGAAAVVARWSTEPPGPVGIQHR